MRRIVTAVTAATLALSLVAQAVPANALVSGYDSAYAGESAFLTLNPGQSGTFTVFFQNTGTTSWTRGTATQVDLLACLEDKVTCDQQDASEAPFNSGWLSATRYATHTQTTVAPGSIGTFTYNVLVPANQAAGTYRFNGDLAVSQLVATLGATTARIHPEGYYQDVTVPTAVGSCTPTAITTTPTNAQNQVGVNHTQSATVTCARPAGATSDPPSVGTQVTFIVDAAAADTGNTDLTLTAVTNASGVATVTWTRSNPGTDTLAVYPTATPAVRATATKRWVAGAFAVQCEPTAAATVLAGQSRTFTVTLRNPQTGALATSTAVDITTTANITATTAQATTSIAGFNFPFTAGTSVQGAGGAAATTTTGAAGTAVFSVIGNPTGTSLAITPRVFVEGGAFGGTANNTLDADEFRVDCGTTTFETLRAATIAVTPDTTATNALNGNRVYTVTATDQFGSAFANADGRMRFSFSEFISGAGTSARRNINFGGGTGQQAGGTSPTPRADCGAAATADQNFALIQSTTGTWFVMVCASAATTGTPMAWYDADGNNFPTTGEVQDTGGAKTWAAAAITSATLTPASATNAASSEEPVTNNNSTGEEKYTSSLADQSGNLFAPSDAAGATVTFTVRNTSSTGNIGITFCALTAADGTTTDTNAGTAALNIIAPNGSATCVLTIPQNSTARAQVEIDRGNSAAGSATVDVSTVHAGVNFVGTQATKTWVATGTFASSVRGGNVVATGTVVAFDRAQDWYTVSTTAGNFTIEYFPTDTYTIDGSTATMAQFESTTAATGLSIGDKVEFRSNPAAGQVNHALTNQ